MATNPVARFGEDGASAGHAPARQPPSPKLSATKVRALSIEHHTALEVMRAGRGNADAIACLVRTVCLAYLIETLERKRAAPRPYHKAESLLEQCALCAAGSGEWRLHDADAVAVAHILAVHDAQLSRIPLPLYREAWERLARAVAGNRGSPIPAG